MKKLPLVLFKKLLIENTIKKIPTGNIKIVKLFDQIHFYQENSLKLIPKG